MAELGCAHLARMADDAIGITDLRKDFLNMEGALGDFAEEYLKISLAMLDLWETLHKCLEPARDSDISMLVELGKIDGEKWALSKGKLEKILEDLEASSGKFSRMCSSFDIWKNGMYERLQNKWKKPDKKLQSVKKWKKASRAILVAALTAACACTIVAAAVVGPLVAVFVACSSGSWIVSPGSCAWTLSENVREGQWEALCPILDTNHVAIRNVKKIKDSVQRLKTEIRDILDTMELANVEDINKKLEIFLKNIKELELQADGCSRDIKQAWILFHQRITKDSRKNKSNKWKRFFCFQ